MGWKDLAKLGKDWADAKKDELLTSDSGKKEAARTRAPGVEAQVKGEAGTSFLEKVLPPDLAKKVTEHRPENVAARQEAERRTDLAGRPVAHLSLTISGDEQGTLAVDLPFKREVDGILGPDPEYPDQPPPMPWLRVLLEALDPVPLGSTTLYSLSLAVPDYRGALGHYDLAELYAKGESGQIESWEVFDLFLSPTLDAGDTIWWWDPSGPGTIDVAANSMSFVLPMISAVSSIRAIGTITWA